MGSKLKKDTTEAVRIDKETVAKVREYKKKKKGGIVIGAFFSEAALKELAHLQIKENEKI